MTNATFCRDIAWGNLLDALQLLSEIACVNCFNCFEKQCSRRTNLFNYSEKQGKILFSLQFSKISQFNDVD